VAHTFFYAVKLDYLIGIHDLASPRETRYIILDRNTLEENKSKEMIRGNTNKK
jgi:hypothetical protein